jgi:hypothetical protein
MLWGGLGVARGDVQTRLLGGAEEDVGRLMRFSDLVMIIAVSVDVGKDRKRAAQKGVVDEGGREAVQHRGGVLQIETSETLKCFQWRSRWMGWGSGVRVAVSVAATADRSGISCQCTYGRSIR